jgi:hypothetical protein
MSFHNKANRPDSKDTAALRKEYQKKVEEMLDSRDSATRAKLRDDRSKLFQRVVAQQVGERKESLREVQKSLAKIGQYKTDEQMAEARAKAESERRSRRERER